tara:strand:- start:104 stop:3133 length:3030 start_codon:yes stop_codon:yes gene_type:complete
MPNLKFSQFQEQTDPANVQFIVGYNGTDNVRIAPGNMIADSQTLSISGNQITISEGNSITLYDQTLGTTDNVEFNDIVADRVYLDPQGTALPQYGRVFTTYYEATSVGNTASNWSELIAKPSGNAPTGEYRATVIRAKDDEANANSVGWITSLEAGSSYRGSGGLLNSITGINAYGQYRGTDPSGSNGATNFVMGGNLIADVVDGSSGSLEYLRGINVEANHNGGSAEVEWLQGMHVHGSLRSSGVVNGGAQVVFLDWDQDGTGSINGDFAYLHINSDTVTGATGTERAICSRSAYPSLFVGSLQSSSFIKTGGTSAQFLKADGSVDASTYLTSATLNLTSEDVTTALGFTPYNATNPDGFTSLIVGAASDQAMAGNTVTITPEQATAITNNTAKTGITSEQATAITNNTAKVSNVQSDWNAVDGLAVILNKPSISGSLAGVTNSDSDTPGGKTALGVGAGNAAETATKNTWIGFDAGNDTTSGDTNVAIGYKASQKITTGFDNVMIGAEAGFTMSAGDANVGVGYRALYSSTVGFSSSVAPGWDSRIDAVAGNYTNIPLGNGLTLSYIDIPEGWSAEEPGDYNYGAITGMTTAIDFEVTIDENSLGGSGGDLLLEIRVRNAGPGRRNTAIGYESLFANNLANENTAVGYESLRNTVEGYDNTAIGTFAMKNNVNGHQNVSLGYQALEGTAGANGNDNVAIGIRSMQDITSGYQNSATGSEALQRVTSGYQNAALGYNSGNSITSGYQNVFIGSNSGREITSSYQNIGIGANSLAELRASSAGYQNVGIGDNTLNDLREGYQNTALGSGAGKSLGQEDEAAHRNTLIGTKSMSDIAEGSNNTCLGYKSGNLLDDNFGVVVNNSTYLGNNALASGSATNEIAIGYNTVGGGSNTIVLGNSSIAALKCQVQTITSLSDKRDKTNIQDSEYGLDLISKLKPVTFDWNMRDGAKVGIKDLGFIAQDLQEVNDDYTQLVDDKNPEKLEASYGRLIPVLVKAIQELKAEIELLKS